MNIMDKAALSQFAAQVPMYKVALASTSHIPSEDTVVIIGMAWDKQEQEGLSWLLSSGSGWLVIPVEEEDDWVDIFTKGGISGSTIAAISVLLDAGFHAVNFDDGAAVIPGLPVFSW